MAEDSRVRAEERAADLAEINRMIESGVKTEVERALRPIQSKNEERFGHLETEMANLKELFKSGHQLPPVQPVVAPHGDGPAQSAWPTQCSALPGHTQVHQQVDAIAATISKARKIISLEPISRTRDVDRQCRQYEGITSNEQAMHSAVMEYLEGELKCRKENVPRIVSIFPLLIIRTMRDYMWSLRMNSLHPMLRALPGF